MMYKGNRMLSTTKPIADFHRPVTAHVGRTDKVLLSSPTLCPLADLHRGPKENNSHKQHNRRRQVHHLKAPVVHYHAL